VRLFTNLMMRYARSGIGNVCAANQHRRQKQTSQPGPHERFRVSCHFKPPEPAIDSGAIGLPRSLSRERYSFDMDEFMRAAIEEAERGLAEGGIPIGSVLVHTGRIVGRGHNRRVQQGSAVLHGEMDALENAGRLPGRVYRACTIYTTLSPCAMCS